MPRRTRPKAPRKTIRSRRAPGHPHNSIERVTADFKRQQAAQGGQDQEAEAADVAAGPEVQDTYGPQARMRSIPATLGAPAQRSREN
jgi:hypothetical protein